MSWRSSRHGFRQSKSAERAAVVVVVVVGDNCVCEEGVGANKTAAGMLDSLPKFK